VAVKHGALLSVKAAQNKKMFEDSDLLGCDVVSVGDRIPTFRGNIEASSSRVDECPSIHIPTLDTEDISCLEQ
jgi:hypothetical protein